MVMPADAVQRAGLLLTAICADLTVVKFQLTELLTRSGVAMRVAEPAPEPMTMGQTVDALTYPSDAQTVTTDASSEPEAPTTADAPANGAGLSLDF